MGNQSVEHSKLINGIIHKLGSRRDCRVWKNHSGLAVTPSGYRMYFGLPGSPDIIGFTSDGEFLAIEGKTGAATLEKDQRNFHRIAMRFGVRIITARTVEDATTFLDSLRLPQIDLTDLFKE